MDRFVEIRFQGKFDQFFVVTYQILDSSSQVIERGEATLPSCLELVASIKDWRGAYQAEVKHPRLENVEASISNSSDINHVQLASDLKKYLNNWLNLPEFLPVKDRLISILNPDQVILIGIDISDPELKYAPWHLWSFFEQFPKADYTLLRPSFIKVNSRSSRSKSKLNVLAIIGDSRGINTAEDTTVIQNLPYIHSPQILGEPSRNEVKAALQSSKSIDILFFAGHGMKVQEKGKICINKNDSLSIGEIKSSLQQRIKQGLQLAIFNSCDGLELGEEIADLHIPQAIVMKEAVPDQIAQKFLKSFLQDFSQGVPFVQALRQTRDKLIDEDHEYPYASWLPVLYCNPTEPLLQWPKPNLVRRYPWRSGLAASFLIGLIGLVGMSAISHNIQTQRPVPVPKPTIAPAPENSVYAKYFQLALPDDWKVDAGGNGITGDDLHLYLSSDQAVSISLNIKEIKNINNESSTLDNYTEQFIKEAKSAWTNFILNEKKLQIFIANRRGSRVYFSTTYESITYKKNTTILLHNNKAYTITYSSPEKSFPNYESIANKIIDSVNLIN